LTDLNGDNWEFATLDLGSGIRKLAATGAPLSGPVSEAEGRE
jgi:hypothetical protein